MEYPTTIKKIQVSNVMRHDEDDDFSTHKKEMKRKTFKAADKKKTLSFFNEISPSDHKYLDRNI